MIPESELFAQLERYKDYRYSRLNPHYPTAVPGVRLAQGPPELTNCCTFVEGLLLPVAASHVVGLEWGLKRHSQMMITGHDRLSPVAALIDAGLADRADPDACPLRWSVVQGWRTPESGHTFIVADSAHGDLVLILEANCAYGLDGVGWRGIGNIRDVGSQFPECWWGKTSWTWARVLDTYQSGIAVCTLRVECDDPVRSLVDSTGGPSTPEPMGGGSIRA